MDRKVSEVWAPQIALWTPGAVLEHTLSNQLCLVTNEGSVTWSRPGRIQSACKFDIAKFPFDKPVCGIEFGSWAKSKAELQLEIADGVNSVGWDTPLPSAPNAFQVTAVTSTVSENSARPTWSCRSANNMCSTSSTIKVSLSLKHEWRSYWWRYMIPQLLVTLGSFGVFWNAACCKERVCAGVVLLLAGVVITSVASASMPFGKEEATMSSFFSMCFFWNLASLTETVMSVSLYYKSDRRLCSCFIRAPHMWVAPEKIAADIDLCSPAEMEKIVRAKEETDLTDWCREHDLASIEQSFRSEEIHTIENLAECRLTEQDLKEYIGIKDIYTRKRVGRLIRLLQGDTEAPATSTMAPILGALVDQIRNGMDNDAMLVEIEEEEYVPRMKTIPPVFAPPPPPVDPELAFDADDYSEYWQMWSFRLDACAKILFPLGFITSLIIQYLDWDMS